MGEVVFRAHADRARRGQWKLEELPWDEPIKFDGSSKRERVISGLDILDLSGVLYHFLLGSRLRMGHHVLHSWSEDESLQVCLEFHDVDEQRHVQAFRQLIALLHKTSHGMVGNGEAASHVRLWRVTYPSRGRLDADRMLVDLLVDEAVTRTLLLMIANSSHVPLVRAVFEACARDDVRHVEYLTTMAQARLEALSAARVAALQAHTVVHVGQVQSALRRHFRSFASVANSSTDQVASEIFGAASRAIGELGSSWRSSPLARMIHGADRSPWILWLLR